MYTGNRGMNASDYGKILEYIKILFLNHLYIYIKIYYFTLIYLKVILCY